MQALELEALIAHHRLEVEHAALPERAERAKVIVLWDMTQAPQQRRAPPPALAGAGVETGDILGEPPAEDWETLA
ncbi:MAG: hypothetical protein HY778_04595 [Betaproteobacteria bacterium]|nr:hypothetical protein [Betaproteobacteria bacterium]